VTREERPTIFDASNTLEIRLRQIPALRCQTAQQADEEQLKRRQVWNSGKIVPQWVENQQKPKS
jgi:hypothetical protein